MENNLTIYQKVALNALQEWNGLNHEDALKTVMEKSTVELEQMIGAKNSINAAIRGLVGNGIDLLGTDLLSEHTDYKKDADLPTIEEHVKTIKELERRENSIFSIFQKGAVATDDNSS